MWLILFSKLLFELDQLANPVSKMYFSPDGSQLFVLCRNERGIRVFDLHAFRARFKELNLDW